MRAIIRNRHGTTQSRRSCSSCPPTAASSERRLGNDVNLRDVEGRSALLLSKAKDNNASCAIGPFIRLFDDSFTLDDVRNTTVTLMVEGEDGFRLEGSSSIAKISRDPEDLVAQTIGPHHQYPDGFVLFLGTMFAPTQDRDAAGAWASPTSLATSSPSRRRSSAPSSIECDTAPIASPGRFGLGALMANLAQRGLL